MCFRREGRLRKWRGRHVARVTGRIKGDRVLATAMVLHLKQLPVSPASKGQGNKSVKEYLSATHRMALQDT